MSVKRYIIHPGYIVSKYDGDKHYITAHELMNLYGVSPNECIIADTKEGTFGLNKEKYEHLYPLFNGEYKRRHKMKTVGNFSNVCNGCGTKDDLHNLIIVVGEGKKKEEKAYKKRVTLCSTCWNKISHLVPVHSFGGVEMPDSVHMEYEND